MKGSTPRSARAKRRSQSRHHVAEQAPVPDGWPDGETLADTLAVNPLAATLLDEMKPDTMRTILQRMDVQLRKAMLEPHNIPVTKVSLRAAGQVLTMLRAEEKPAEGKLLGSLLSPAADLFNEAHVEPTQVTGLGLKLVDLALPMLVNSESTFKGLRTWHRWCDESFEDLTLVAVIGQQCSHATLAAAYLAHSHPEIAQRYESMRSQYPRIPQIFESRLTTSNPLSRYLAARPDRKLPNTAAELRSLLQEDTRVRDAEVERTRQQRAQAAAERERRNKQRDDALLRHPPESDAAEVPAPKPDPLTTPSDPNQSALPSVAEWAAAVTDSRALTQRLIDGEPPDLQRLRSIIDLSLRVTNMATLVGRVLGEEVKPQRGDVDRSLTVILADEALSAKLGEVPRTVADTTAALQRLDPLPSEQQPSAPSPGESDSADPVSALLPGAASTQPPDDDRSSTSVAANPPVPTPSAGRNETTTADESVVDLSDLDAILHGEAGARLAALASPAASTAAPQPPHQRSDSESHPLLVTEAESRDNEVDAVPYDDPEAAELERRLVATATWARHPDGPLCEEYAACMSQLDVHDHLEPDPGRRLLVAATALPMALIDPASGATKLLDLDVPELDDWPNVVAFRKLIADFTRNGCSLYAPDMQRQAVLSHKLTRVTDRAKQLRASAATRTLKYDKATKVYRAWFSHSGRLRPLLDSLETTEVGKLQGLMDEAHKVGPVRAINETLTELFDRGKPRIVAGARQSLVDAYEEILDMGATTLAVHQAIRDGDQHDAARRFQRVAEFVAKAADMQDAVLSDLKGPHPPPAAVRFLVHRAVQFGNRQLPLTGPEPSAEWILARPQLQPDQTP